MRESVSLWKRDFMAFQRIPGFFKFTPYRDFDFKPRYYDAGKERMEERRKNAEIELRMEDSPYTRIHEGFLRKRVESEKRKYMIRLALIITIFVALFFWILS